MASVEVRVTVTKDVTVEAEYGDTPEALKQRALDSIEIDENADSVQVQILTGMGGTDDEIPPVPTNLAYTPENEDGNGNQITNGGE